MASAVSATESVARLPSSNCEEARCSGTVSSRQNPFKTVSHLLVERPERKPLGFHLVRSAMLCFKKRIGLTRHRPSCDRRSSPLPLGSIDQFETIEEPPNVCCVGPRWIAKQ